MKILLVGMQKMVLSHFNAWSGLQEMQMKCWLERVDSCWLLTAFCNDFFLSCGFHLPLAGANPRLFDPFSWKSLGCSY